MAAAIPASQRPRRRTRLVSAVAAVAFSAALALVSCPTTFAHAAAGEGGLRGGEIVSQHVEEAAASTTNAQEQQQQQRALAAAGEIITLNPFTIKLLATNFPYQMKSNQDNEISSIVGTYLASYLTSTLASNVDNLGVGCTRSTATIGIEQRWIIKCDDGRATFTGEEDDAAVNRAVSYAFTGSAMNDFIEIMYPSYEMVHEKQEYDTRFVGTARHGGGHNHNNKNKRGNKVNKRKKQSHKNNRKKNNKNAKRKKNKGKRKPRDSPQMMMQSSGGGGNKNNGLNVMGYVSGSQNMQQNSGGKNLDKNGNIVVKLP